MSIDPEVRRIRAMRLRAQGLVPQAQPWTDPADVARGMLAMQAQDAGGVRWALSLRAANTPTDEEVVDDLGEGLVVRNRPSRGTLQIAAPEDMHWLSAVMSVRAHQGAIRRRPNLKLTDAMVGRVEELICSELATGVRTRPELVQACADAGLTLDNGQAGHILRHLTEKMAIVFAHPTPKVDSFARPEDWIAERREPEEPLAEVVTRFVGARGPVTRQDIGRWSDLSMGSVDAGIEAASGSLERVNLAGDDYLVLRGTTGITESEVDAALTHPLLLPPFDEYLIGYGSREPVLDERFFERIVPGRNGMFKPIVVVDGEVVGIWSQKRTPKKVTVTVEPFGAMKAKVARALAEPVSAYGRFLGRPAELAPIS
ncbi:MAG TPA: winged helix DNA-binding domain-containing protein [Marmoricola sp.]|nr:winged helix DNA-binding domain-containing protein [Marmoricola sp.]